MPDEAHEAVHEDHRDTTEPPRRHARVRADIPARISTIEPDVDPRTGRHYFRASTERCANLSRGGAFIQTEELLDPGRRVLVELSLPGGGQVEAIARVAWSQHALATPEGERGRGVGIEFLGGAAEHFTVLEAFVERGEDEGGGH